MRLRAVLALVSGLAALLAVAAPAGAIVNGRQAKDGEYPFMASIQDADGFAYCGGTVIARQWVLTAAHCVEDEKAAAIRVVTGKTDLADGKKGQVLKVSAVHVHPKWDGNAWDAAVLRLSQSTTSPAIRLAGSTDDGLEREGTPVTTAGWGDTLPTLGLFATNKLRSTDLSVVGDSRCGNTNIGFHAPTGVCAEDLLTDSCFGDSGGPLWAVKSGVRIQIGVVSYGTGCATPGFPGVYAEVNNPDIRSFIKTKTGV